MSSSGDTGARPARRRRIAQLDPIVLALRHALVQAGISQRELARRSGISIATISNIFSGVHEPSLSTTRALCGVLDLRLIIEPPRPRAAGNIPPTSRLTIPTKEEQRAHW